MLLLRRNVVRRLERPIELLMQLLLLAAIPSCGIAGAQQTPTTTILTLSSSSVTSGTAVTLNVIVGPATVGQVRFYDGQIGVATAQVSSSGQATVKLRFGAGIHVLTAVFGGTTLYQTSVSNRQVLSVTSTAATTLSASGGPGSYTLTATVAGSPTLGPTGTVTFTDTTDANRVLGTATLGSATMSQGFQPQISNPVGYDPYSAVVGDFNADGVPDLAVANSSDDTVGILLGNGDGTFRAQVTYATGTYPIAATVGDFNNDGHLDIAIANLVDNTVSVLLGNGDGTFQQQMTFATGNSPFDLKTGDFNSDGNLDLVVANNSDNTVSLLLGNGDGTFQQQTTFATGNSPFEIAVADFNGDGALDMAVANDSDNTVSVLLGNGGGSFQTQVSYPAGRDPVALAAGDLNGDGVPDLAVANGDGNAVTVLLGKGDGTFPTQNTYPVGEDPESIAIGDFNGDGHLDLAVANFNDATAGVLLGKGDGTFPAQLPYAVDPFPASIVVGDWNGDGVPDLATANLADTNGTVSVLLNSSGQSSTAMIGNVAIYGGGTHQVTAVYGGNTFYGQSTSGSVALQGALIPTSLALVATPGKAGAKTVALSATVQPAGAYNYTASGSVTFYNNGVSLGAGVVANGIAALTTSLPGGSDTITAVYSGDANFGGSTSPPITLTADFTLTATPTSETIPIGNAGAFLLTLQSLNGFSSSVNLSCSGGPSGSQCGELPAKVKVNGTAYAAGGIVFPAKTAPGSYTITFTATFGSLTHNVSVVLVLPKHMSSSNRLLRPQF